MRNLREVPGVGVLSFNWDAIARLVETFGQDFDAKLSEAFIHSDVRTIAQAVAIGTGKTVDEIMLLSPPIVATSNAISVALNLAFHGPKGAPPAKGESNPPRWISWIKRAVMRSAPD